MSTEKLTLARAFPAFIGNTLEWYDFSIFAFFSPIISQLFFPSSNKIASFLSTYAVFALGFFIRPIGATVFGYFGDNYGRKKTLVLSMLVISLATFVMGILPTYNSIGVLAPILLVLCRLLQGFCIGGETAGSAAYILESFPEHKRGVLGGFMWTAVGCGLLLSSLVTTITTSVFSEDLLYQYGWRIPFILSVVTALVGLYFRQKLPESILFAEYKSQKSISTVSSFTMIHHHRKSVFIIIGLYALSAMITYLLFVFMPSYASTVLGIPLNTASTVTTFALASVTFGVPLGGWLSDYIGRKPCLLIGAAGFLLLSYPLYHFMVSQQTVSSFILAEAIFVLFAIFYQGTLNTAVQEIPPTAVRYTISSVGYNLSYAIFGGTAPFIVTLLSSLAENKSVPGMYLVFGSVLSLLAVVSMGETAYKKMS